MRLIAEPKNSRSRVPQLPRTGSGDNQGRHFNSPQTEAFGSGSSQWLIRYFRRTLFLNWLSHRLLCHWQRPPLLNIPQLPSLAVNLPQLPSLAVNISQFQSRCEYPPQLPNLALNISQFQSRCERTSPPSRQSHSLISEPCFTQYILQRVHSLFSFRVFCGRWSYRRHFAAAAHFHAIHRLAGPDSGIG